MSTVSAAASTTPPQVASSTHSAGLRAIPAWSSRRASPRSVLVERSTLDARPSAACSPPVPSGGPARGAVLAAPARAGPLARRSGPGDRGRRRAAGRPYRSIRPTDPPPPRPGASGRSRSSAASSTARKTQASPAISSHGRWIARGAGPGRRGRAPRPRRNGAASEAACAGSATWPPLAEASTRELDDVVVPVVVPGNDVDGNRRGHFAAQHVLPVGQDEEPGRRGAEAPETWLRRRISPRRCAVESGAAPRTASSARASRRRSVVGSNRIRQDVLNVMSPARTLAGQRGQVAQRGLALRRNAPPGAAPWLSSKIITTGAGRGSRSRRRAGRTGRTRRAHDQRDDRNRRHSSTAVQPP